MYVYAKERMGIDSVIDSVGWYIPFMVTEYSTWG